MRNMVGNLLCILKVIWWHNSEEWNGIIVVPRVPISDEFIEKFSLDLRKGSIDVPAVGHKFLVYLLFWKQIFVPSETFEPPLKSSIIIFKNLEG